METGRGKAEIFNHDGRWEHAPLQLNRTSQIACTSVQWGVRRWGQLRHLEGPFYIRDWSPTFGKTRGAVGYLRADSSKRAARKIATPHLGLFILWSFHGGTGLSVLFSFIVLVCSGVGWARERSRQEASLQDAALLAAGLAWLVHRSADGVIEDLFQALLRESGAFQVSGGSDFLRH